MDALTAKRANIAKLVEEYNKQQSGKLHICPGEYIWRASIFAGGIAERYIISDARITASEVDTPW